jgi:ParB family chromosome partitioning protein
MARRSGLGRGLGSLIPTADDEPIPAAGLAEIPITAIRPNRHQPRLHFDEDALGELTASITAIGVLQPILVRQVFEDDGAVYELIAGERRWRAAERAGMATIPALIRVGDDQAAVEQALVENLHREDLTPLEEAAAYQQLIEDFGLTHEQVADRVGKSRSAVTNTLRLMGLSPVAQQLLADGRLSAGHARALLGAPDRAFQERLARRAAEEGWTVRAVEEAVRRGPDPSGPRPRPGKSSGSADRPAGVLEVERLLAEWLETRVSVESGGRRGRLMIEFADLADLTRIFATLEQGRPGAAAPSSTE